MFDTPNERTVKLLLSVLLILTNSIADGAGESWTLPRQGHNLLRRRENIPTETVAARDLQEQDLPPLSAPANFRANYRGDFHTYVHSACSKQDWRPTLRALCVGKVALVGTSSDAIVCNEIPLVNGTLDGYPGYGSGLICSNTCMNSNECQQVFVEHSGKYVSSGTWGEVYYSCEGSDVEDVDTSFVLDAKEGRCNSEMFYMPRHVQLSKLNVFCPQRGKEGEYVNDDMFFECAGRGTSSIVPFGGFTSETYCAMGNACQNCDIEFPTQYVNADVHQFQHECVQQVNHNVPIPVPKPPKPVLVDLIPAGDYTAEFQARWAVIVKTRYLNNNWDNPFDSSCTAASPTTRVTCENGEIHLLEKSSNSIACDYVRNDVLACTETAGTFATINSFSGVTYECRTTNTTELPTSKVETEPSNITCNKIFEYPFDGTGGVCGLHAVQLGLSCGSVLAGTKGFHYPDLIFECGQVGNVIHFLEEGKFTCLDGYFFQDGVDEGISKLVPTASVQTDWRYNAFPDASDGCFSFEPTTQQVTPEPMTTTYAPTNSTQSENTNSNATTTDNGAVLAYGGNGTIISKTGSTDNKGNPDGVFP